MKYVRQNKYVLLFDGGISKVEPDDLSEILLFPTNILTYFLVHQNILILLALSII